MLLKYPGVGLSFFHAKKLLAFVQMSCFLVLGSDKSCLWRTTLNLTRHSLELASFGALGFLVCGKFVVFSESDFCGRTVTFSSTCSSVCVVWTSCKGLHGYWSVFACLCCFVGSPLCLELHLRLTMRVG